MDCAYCERPLICDACQAAYQPETPEEYGALSMRDAEVDCPACGQVLVCHWCKTPYDGQGDDEADAAGGASGGAVLG